MGGGGRRGGAEKGDGEEADREDGRTGECGSGRGIMSGDRREEAGGGQRATDNGRAAGLRSLDTDGVSLWIG